MSPEPAALYPEHGRIKLPGLYRKQGNLDIPAVLTIAISVQADEFPRRFRTATDAAFALEYTPDPRAPELITPQITPFLSEGVPVRFHCRFGEFELGNADPVKAAEALGIHTRVIDAITGLGEPVVTVHLNLSKKIPFDIPTAVANLTSLTAYGRAHGITVCLENLRQGPSSLPDNILSWARASGAMITMDVGHAVSSQVVKEDKTGVADIAALFGERLYEVHMYGREEDRHYPVEDMVMFGPIIESLLRTRCAWWTIELADFDEALATRQLLLHYLETRLET